MNVMLKPDEISWLGQDSQLIFAVSQQPFLRELQQAQRNIPSLQKYSASLPRPMGRRGLKAFLHLWIPTS